MFFFSLCTLPSSEICYKILFKLKPKFCNFHLDQNFFLNKIHKTRELTLEQRQELIT